MVNKTIPNNCLVVGMPAKIVRENVHWTKEDIIK
jgi:serine acetyltransferase